MTPFESRNLDHSSSLISGRLGDGGDEEEEEKELEEEEEECYEGFKWLPLAIDSTSTLKLLSRFIAILFHHFNFRVKTGLHSNLAISQSP